MTPLLQDGRDRQRPACTLFRRWIAFNAVGALVETYSNEGTIKFIRLIINHLPPGIYILKADFSSGPVYRKIQVVE